MNELAELLPIEKTVPLGSGTVTVTGLSLRKVAVLISRYPELLSLLNGKADLVSLVTGSPQTALDIASLGLKENDQENTRTIQQSFDDAPLGQQADILGAIMELTLAGQRLAPFLEGVMRGYARTMATNPAPETSTGTSADSSSS